MRNGSRARCSTSPACAESPDSTTSASSASAAGEGSDADLLLEFSGRPEIDPEIVKRAGSAGAHLGRRRGRRWSVGDAVRTFADPGVTVLSCETITLEIAMRKGKVVSPLVLPDGSARRMRQALASVTPADEM